MTSGQSDRKPTIERLCDAVGDGKSILITGPLGIGKTHILKAVEPELVKTGRKTYIIRGSTPGSSVTLGAFAGSAALSLPGKISPGELVEAFAKQAKTSVLLVDNVDLLDEASLYVVVQLLTVPGFPVIMTTRDLCTAPVAIHRGYDSGELNEIVIEPLTDQEASHLIEELLEGGATPGAQAQLVAASGGNPLHLREIIRGSMTAGSLIRSPKGWELQGKPRATRRLTQILGSRFQRMSGKAVDTATVVALAGEYPVDAMSEEDRDLLIRRGIIDIVDEGWVSLSNPIDAEYLTTRCSPALLKSLARRAAGALQETNPANHPVVQRQSALLALDYGFDIDTKSMVMLAEHALAAADLQLALRAATTVSNVDPGNVPALRVAGLASSLLGEHSVADEHFASAKAGAVSDAELTTVALAHAQHLGAAKNDQEAALAVVDEALRAVSERTCVDQLRGAALRWSIVAGHTPAGSRTDPSGDEDTVMSLILKGLSAVTSGPLRSAERHLNEVKQVSQKTLATIPGGDALIDLTESKALLFSGDAEESRLKLRHNLETVRGRKPESLGIWEYALGFLELFSCDAEEAYHLSRRAVEHLSWRDTAGLLPAAHALKAASAMATGRSLEVNSAIAEIPRSATSDPNIIFFGAWRRAWQASAERRAEQASGYLLDGARWLVTAQHTYLVGLLAHCLIRQGRRIEEATELLKTARDQAGGGMLDLFVDHAEAMLAGNHDALEHVASDAEEHGFVAMAADSWLWLSACDGPETQSLRYLFNADKIRNDVPTAALWNAVPKASTLLTDREHKVVEYAADRYTAKEIATIHKVSVNTVTNQLASAFRKLGISSREELRELLGKD